MEAVGQLAGGIAHDFNNSITLIKVCSQLALQEIKEEDAVKDKLKQIDEATGRSADLARQLLNFSRRQVAEAKILDLNNIVTNLNKMLQRVIGENIELVNKMAERLWPIKVDPGHIEQIIINLTVNARDAMPEGGKLILETANVVLNETPIRIDKKVISGEYVRFSVADTGMGMAPATMEHIFEPFFTTKTNGKGTGLGLFMVHGILKKYGGHIVVESKMGLGSTFEIYLPRAAEQMQTGREEIVKRDIPRGGEMVLVVEDEKDLLKLVADGLEQQGYKVLQARNGGEALLIFDKYKERIGLLVTDIIMPIINGFELADALMELYPRTKILYTSGYLDNPSLQQRNLDPETNFIPKLFSMGELAFRMRKILDS